MPWPQIRPEDGFDVGVIEEVGVPGLDDRLSSGAPGPVSQVRVLDGDVEPKLTVLELPSDAAVAGQPTPVGDDAAAVAAHLEGLGVVEVGLDDLGEAAESHPRDGPVESSAPQSLNGVGCAEPLVECPRRVDCLGQRDQTVGQCPVAGEQAPIAPELVRVNLVECPGQVAVADVHPWAREREGWSHEAQQHVTGGLRPAFTVAGRPRERIGMYLLSCAG